MAFNSSVTLVDTSQVANQPDGLIQADLQAALANLSPYITGIGTLAVKLNLLPYPPFGLPVTGQPSGGTFEDIGNGFPSTDNPIGGTASLPLVEPSSVNELITGSHDGESSDLNINLYAANLPTLMASPPFNLFSMFEHALIQGLGWSGDRIGTGTLAGQETVFDALSDDQGLSSDVFTGSNAMAVYGGPVPLTVQQTGSNFYDLGTTGTGADPAILSQDLMSPQLSTSTTISRLDLAILEDIGVPLTVAAQDIVNPYLPALTDIYMGELGRAPDASGIAAYTAQLDAGISLAGVSTEVADSVEAETAIGQIYANELGRWVDQASLVGLVNSLANGNNLATIRLDTATSPEAAAAINARYVDTVGRAATPDDIAGWQQNLSAGGSLATLVATGAASPEAAAAISASYLATLGRAATAADVSGWQQQLAAGSSIATLVATGAASPEAAAAISASYLATLGRAATAADVSGWQQQLAAGSSIATLVATGAASPEAAAAISASYLAVLGRAATAADVSGWQQQLAAGSSIQILNTELMNSPEFASHAAAAETTASGTTVTSATAPTVATSPSSETDAASGITAAYQAATQQSPGPVESAGYESQIASGIPLQTVQAEIAELAGGPIPLLAGGGYAITPQTIAGSGPDFVYGLLNNDDLIAGQADSVTLSSTKVSLINGFNPVTDVIQLHVGQVANFSALQHDMMGANGGTLISLPGNTEMLLDATPSQLQATNFRFV